MLEKSRGLSAGLFMLVLLALLLPFARVTCSGQEVARFTGYELAFGKSISTPSVSAFDSSHEQRKVEPNVFAILILAAAIAGGLMCLTAARGGAIARLVASGAGLLLLIMLQSSLSQQMTREARGVLRLEMQAGYPLAIVAFLAATILNVLTLVLRPSAAPVTAGASLGPPPGPPPDAVTARYCSHCGKPLGPDDSFCPGCGSRA